MRHLFWNLAGAAALAAGSTGCSVLAVADAAVSAAATTVSIGASVVGTTVDVAASGVKAVAGSSEEEEKENGED